MLKTKSALSYFGSDSEVAPEIAKFFDQCNHVTIPFCGGLSILPYLKARSIVANDIHSKAINFYRHASGVYGEECQRLLIERCQKTLSHPEDMIDANMRLKPAWNGSWVQAWAFWAVCWIGRKGKGGTKYHSGMPSVRRTGSGGSNASRIRSASEDLSEWTKHFERCEWESVCFRDLLPKVADNPGCGIYCDPPWVDAGDSYLHSFDVQDHIDLAECLSRFDSTTVVVRYGDNPLIRKYYDEMGWTIIEAESRDQCNAIKDEIWITNIIKRK